MKKLRVAVIVPTRNGCGELRRLLNSLAVQTQEFDIFLVDSSSSDGTQELIKERTGSIFSIPAVEFNHGGTRQMMVDRNAGYDCYVFLTQDSYLVGSGSLDLLISHFKDERVGAVCGRQLPHLDANALARHAREFSYPDRVEIKVVEDTPRLGIKAAFMSNSFAAYRASALEEIGGFPDHVIFGEDMYVAAKMLLCGWKVAYAGDAKCYHSHNYTFVAEFKRYFDMGVFHAREPWILENFGGAGGEGVRYVVSELGFLGWKRFYLWPISILRNGAKLIAYRLGRAERYLSIRIKRRIGMHRGFWEGEHLRSKTYFRVLG